MITQYSAVFALLVTCMGVLGLASISINRKLKEIGIRKVLGAQRSQIIRYVIKDYIILIIMANAITWPIAYIFADNWLQGFVNRIPIGIELFLFAGIITLVVVLFAVGTKVIQAALSNPVNALKCE